MHGPATPIAFGQNLGAQRVVLDPPQTYHLANWNRLTDQQRVAFLRQVAEQRGRDPRVRELVFGILQQAGADQREYVKHAAVLLKWVQDNILYLNEPGEILQDPLYTLQKRAGDCDDLADLLASLYEAARLPWRYVLSGFKPNGEKVRWVEGDRMIPGVKWAHIYLAVGSPPFRPTEWRFAEPSIKGVPLGWDVIAASEGRTAPGSTPASVLPELAAMHGVDASALPAPVAAMASAFEGWDWTKFHQQVAFTVAVGLASSLVLVALRKAKVLPKL